MFYLPLLSGSTATCRRRWLAGLAHWFVRPAPSNGPAWRTDAPSQRNRPWPAGSRYCPISPSPARGMAFCETGVIAAKARVPGRAKQDKFRSSPPSRLQTRPRPSPPMGHRRSTKSMSPIRTSTHCGRTATPTKSIANCARPHSGPGTKRGKKTVRWCDRSHAALGGTMCGAYAR